MPNFTLAAPPYVIAITGYQPKGGIIRNGRHFKPHGGPTIELTFTSPHDALEVFNVPFPIENLPLRKRVAFHGGLLASAEGKALKELIMQFAAYVINNHGWSKPYRPHPEGYADCILKLNPVTAKATVGKADAMETVTSWF
jgi:hypothetical protein